MGKSIVKEIFIGALLLMVIMFTLGIVLYEYIPTNQAIPEPVQYSADSSVTQTLQEIAADAEAEGIEDTETSGAQSLLKSYSIGASDLKSYASKKSYESGKVDPFAEYVEPTNTTNTTATNTTQAPTSTVAPNATAGQSSTSNTGTFFEKSNSK